MEESRRIAENLEKIKDRIFLAARRSGRDPDHIRLIVVTKTIDIERIQAAMEAGAELFGENYVQEAKKKIEALKGTCARWHFIGHLQRNKAKYAASLFDTIHSVDSITLAEELNKRAKQNQTVLKTMIQVNVSGEETKEGVDEKGLRELASAIRQMPHLRLDGLMTMPPYFEDPERARPYFRKLRKLRDMLAADGIETTELSMGMSGDFEVAIEEGATYVRIGTAIFGRRPT